MADSTHEPTVSYAQNREHIILAAFFPDLNDGFYVDVGANHPISDSVTKLFYEKGWRGINIEPIKSLHKQLEEDRPEDTNLALGVSSKTGTAKFTEFEVDGLSTFSDEMVKVSKDEAAIKDKYDVKIDTLGNIFKDHRVDSINFMKIDIEGYEHDALLGNDWDKYRPEVICIESNHVDHDWRPILIDNGYSLAFFDGLNEYYVEEKSIEREAMFRENYPKLLVKAPIIQRAWQKVIEDLSGQLERVQDSLDERASTAKRLEEELNAAHQELEHCKTELKGIEEAQGIRHHASGLADAVKSRLKKS